jgi:GxxExxY protein
MKGMQGIKAINSESLTHTLKCLNLFSVSGLMLPGLIPSIPRIPVHKRGSPVIHEDLTERIIKACFEVSNELGCGFLESVYHNSLLIALEHAGLNPRSKFPLKVMFRNQIVGEFYPDIIVDDTVLIEIKSVKALAPEHLAQVMNYLKATGIETGLLINFGNPKLEYRRFGNRF